MSNDRRLHMPVGLCQATIRYTVAGQQVRNVIYVRHMNKPTSLSSFAPAAPDDSFATVVLNRIAAWLHGTIAPGMPASFSADGVDLVWNEAVPTGPLTGRSYVGSDLPIVGTNTSSTPVPNSTSFAFSLKTAHLGRSYHGRFFWPCVREDTLDTDRQHMKASDANFFAGTLNTLRATLSSLHGDPLTFPQDASPMQVASFYQGKDPTTGKPQLRVTALANEVTGITYSDLILDTQRKRLPGRGR